MKIKNTCFVCKKTISTEYSEINSVVNMRVCKDCKGTEKEKQTKEEYLDSLADGLVCGCI